MHYLQPGERYEREVTPAERFFAHSPYAVVTMVARIRGAVSEDQLAEAVRKVQPRHALLNVRLKQGPDHALRFTSDGVQAIPIKAFDRRADDDWIEILDRETRIPFAFETRPGIRFILVGSPQESEVMILCHHLICDGMSLAYLARDLLVSLGDPDREIERLPVPEPISLANLPPDVRQPGLVRALIGRMNKSWVDERTTFDQGDYEAINAAYYASCQHAILPVEWSREETTALVERCRGQGVTLNSALTAAFCGAQRALAVAPYHALIVIAADVRTRLAHPPGEGMGMYAGSVELKFKYRHKESFWQNARRLHKLVQSRSDRKLFSNLLNWLYLDPTILEAMHFKKLGGLVSRDSERYNRLAAFAVREDVVSKLLKRDQLDTMEAIHWGTAVTNLGRLDFPTSFGGLELERLIFQPGGGIPLSNVGLVVGAVTCSGRLSVVVEHAEQAVDRRSVASIAEQATAYLRS